MLFLGHLIITIYTSSKAYKYLSLPRCTFNHSDSVICSKVDVHFYSQVTVIRFLLCIVTLLVKDNDHLERVQRRATYQYIHNLLIINNLYQSWYSSSADYI